MRAPCGGRKRNQETTMADTHSDPPYVGELLEQNVEATFACDPWEQRGGYLKRCRGIEMLLNSTIGSDIAFSR